MDNDFQELEFQVALERSLLVQIEYKSSTVSGSGYFAVFGLEIAIFEFLAGQRVNNVEYSKFKSGSTVLNTMYKVSGSQSIVGMGLSF